MNVFASAMSLIQSINKCEKVIIKNRTSIFNKNTGLYEDTESLVEASAQVQPTESYIDNVADTATGSVNSYKLWFINLTPIIVDALCGVGKLNTKVQFLNGITAQITKKEDYSFNGWIYCEAVQNEYCQ